jgi:acyl carrier protein
MTTTITQLIDRETHLALPASDITPPADLFALGLTAYDAICLLVAIEHEFGVEFPREALKRETMGSIDAIGQALAAATPKDDRKEAA